MIGIDRDAEILEAAREKLADHAGRFELRHEAFSDLGSALEACGVDAVDAVLFDLGVSSPQLDLGPSLSADMRSLYFNSTRGSGDDRDIYVVTRTSPDETFFPQNVRELSPAINTPFTEGGPCISRNELVLLFYSDRPRIGWRR